MISTIMFIFLTFIILAFLAAVWLVWLAFCGIITFIPAVTITYLLEFSAGERAPVIILLWFLTCLLTLKIPMLKRGIAAYHNGNRIIHRITITALNELQEARVK